MKKLFLRKNIFAFGIALLGFAFFFSREARAEICAGISGTTSNLSATTCVISGVMGIDHPNNIETSITNESAMTIQNSSITINPGSVLAAGRLTIGSGVTILLAEGGQILSGRPLYMEDKDGDGWPNDGTIFTSTASGRRRVGLMRSRTTFDCNDTAGNYDVVNNMGPWYQDADSDGYGRSSVTSQACQPPAGYVANSTDCNDGSGSVWISGSACYPDVDGDTFTTAASSATTCRNNATCTSATAASSSTDGAAVTVYGAGALKVSGSGTVDCKDTGTSANLVAYSLTCYYDGDNDDYGTATTRTCFNTGACATATYGSTGAANDVINVNFASNASDCYDGNANAKPGSTTCSTANRGDGSFDYNCSGTNTICGGDYQYQPYSWYSERCSKDGNRCVAGTAAGYAYSGTACGGAGYTCWSMTGTACSVCSCPSGCQTGTAICNGANAGTQSCQ